MALAHVHFFSQALWMNCSMDVAIPERNHGFICKDHADGKLPALYLLHGAGEDHTAWQRHTSIERYAESLGLAVIMPAAQLSYYSNMAYGGAYFDYLTEELPRIVCEFFHVSGKREDTFIAGSSMGGYGAMKIGLSKPEKYSAIGCFSLGSFMNGSQGKLALDPRINRWLKLAFGVDDPSELQGTEHDLIVLADKAVREGKPLPRIFHACGQQDDPQILDVARTTRELFRGKPFDYSYFEGPGGHTWTFWDEWIQKFLEWLVEPTDRLHGE